jgi:AAHS family 4-hydroxybenzoate transporter-like MFS transporter
VHDSTPGVAAADPSPAIDLAPLVDEGAWGNRQKLFVLVTALAIVFDGADNQLLGIALPAMMRDWALPRSAFAPMLASGMLGMMVGGAIAGLVGDRLGRKVALVGSVLVFGPLTSAVALVDSLWALATLRFLAGLGLGGALPNAAALASEFVPRRHRPLAVTLTIVCVPLGGTLAALLAGAVLPALGWRALFGIGGALPVAVALVLFWLVPESPRFLAKHQARWAELTGILRGIGRQVPDDASFVDSAEPAVARASIGSLFAPELRRDTLALFGAFFSCLLAVYVAFNWVPSMLTGAGLSLAVASNGLAAFNLGGVAGALGGAVAITRLGSRAALLAMSAGAAAGALALAALPLSPAAGTAALIVMLGVTGGLINGVQTTMYALAAHVYPTSVRATGVGTAVAVGRSGGVLSTYVGAWALEAGGSRMFFAAIAAAMGLVFACLALVRRHVPGRAGRAGVGLD